MASALYLGELADRRTLTYLGGESFFRIMLGVCGDYCNFGVWINVEKVARDGLKSMAGRLCRR